MDLDGHLVSHSSAATVQRVKSISTRPMPPLLQFARYREIADDLASRDDVIVASAGLASSILWRAAVLGGRPVGKCLSTIDTFARRVLNDCGEYPHGASDSE